MAKIDPTVVGCKSDCNTTCEATILETFEVDFRISEDKSWNASDASARCFYTSLYLKNRRINCRCEDGYEGNPYLLAGCKDVNECEDPYSNTCLKSWDCENTPGGFTCNIRKSQMNMIIIIGISSSLGVVILLFITGWLYKKRNGGLLLQPQLSSRDQNIQNMKIFHSNELENATDHFNEDRILDWGGQGTVYKGMLADGRIVAIKKSKKVDEAYLEQFVNEIVILSQVNHINVVKLFGCCLETEVPLLVYEFIPNGTLYQFIHSNNEEFPLTWNLRLRITTEVAGPISYLHSAAIVPIYHRDIKKLADIARRSFNSNGRLRPTMREVAMELEKIKKASNDQENSEEYESARSDFGSSPKGYVTASSSDLSSHPSSLPSLETI